MRKTSTAIALFVALLASALLSDEIIAFDTWLWAAAPTHAYGLVVFFTIDLVLIAMLWGGIRYAGALSIIMAGVQFLAMVGDLAGISLPSGVPASAFRIYLLNDSPFVLLLSLQPAIVCLGALYRRRKAEITVRNRMTRILF